LELPITDEANCWELPVVNLATAGVTTTTVRTGNDRAFEVPPPGSAVVTTMVRLPALARIAARRWANSSEELVNVVAKGLPFA
jgi:hypothetical protein